MRSSSDQFLDESYRYGWRIVQGNKEERKGLNVESCEICVIHLMSNYGLFGASQTSSTNFIYFYLFIYLFIYFLAALDLRCCTWAFSS